MCSTELSAEDVEKAVRPYYEKAAYVESSVFKALKKHNEEMTVSRNERQKWRNLFGWGGGIALAALILGGIQLVVTTNSIIDNAHKALNEQKEWQTSTWLLKEEHRELRSVLEKFRISISKLENLVLSFQSPEHAPSNSENIHKQP